MIFFCFLVSLAGPLGSALAASGTGGAAGGGAGAAGVSPRVGRAGAGDPSLPSPLRPKGRNGSSAATRSPASLLRERAPLLSNLASSKLYPAHAAVNALRQNVPKGPRGRRLRLLQLPAAITQDAARDHQPVDLAGALEEVVDLGVAHPLFEEQPPRVAGGTGELHALLGRARD